MKTGPFVTLALVLFATAWGCGSSSTPTATVTFTQVYADILTQYGCATCHAPGGKGEKFGNLNMSTKALAWANLVGVPAAGSSCATSNLERVVKDNAAESLIVQKVESAKPPCGAQMPLNCGKTGAPSCLPESAVQELETWINGGALDD